MTGKSAKAKAGFFGRYALSRMTKEEIAIEKTEIALSATPPRNDKQEYDEKENEIKFFMPCKVSCI